MKEKITRAYERYAKQIDALLLEMSAESEDRLNRRTGGGWSALQTMHHILLVEERTLFYLQKKMSHAPVLPRAGSGVWIRSSLLWMALHLPFKFKAPETVGEEHLPERSSLPELRAQLLSVRRSWLDFLDRMPAEWLDKAIYRHPRAGLLGWAQLMDFFRQHTARHTGQIRRAIASAQG